MGTITHISNACYYTSYIESGGIVSSLDLHTRAKLNFLRIFREVMLEPRGLAYLVQFAGRPEPTRWRRPVSLLASLRGGAASSPSATPTMASALARSR